MEDKYYSGKAGMICGSIGLTMNVYQGKMDNVQGKHTPILALKPPADAFAPIDASKEPRGYMISALSDVKEEAFAFLEYWASPEGLITEKLGLPGVHHTVSNGKYELTDKHSTHEPLFYEPNMPAPLETFVPAATKSFNYAGELVTFDNKFAFPEELQPQADSAENTYWEYSYKFITGEIPLSEFDAYVDTWLKAGGQDITDYANTVLK
jgi:putative aldouronate transport system substrate-binding protein